MEFPRRLVAFMAGVSVPLFVEIIQALLQQNTSIECVDFVIGDRPSFRWAQAQDVDPRIRFRYQHARLNPWERGRTVDDHRVAELEERYGLPHLWRYIRAQRMIEHLSHERKLAYLQAYLEYFETLFDETKPGVFISGSPDSLPFMVGHEVFKRKGCITIPIAPGRFPARFFIVENELEQIRDLDETYRGLKTRALTPSEREAVQNLRVAYVTKRVRPPYYRLRARLSVIPSPVRFIRILRRRLFDDDRYFDYTLPVYARRGVLFRLRQPWQELVLRGLVSRPPEGERFFYLPLNYEPEWGIDVQSGFYRDQVAVVERVAGGLPVGYVLYIKEHPNMLAGGRPLGFYRRLRDLGAVRILPRDTDSYEILQRTTGVITIGGTTGVEALFHGKPVLLVGHAFYEAFTDGVYRAAGFEDIPRALARMAATPRIDEALFDRFVTAVLARTYPGLAELTAEGATEPSNYAAIARGIAQEVRFLLRVA